MSETTTSYPAARTVQLGVNHAEDRVVLVCDTAQHGRRAAWLTRRLMRRLLNRYAGFLADSNPTAAQAGPGHREDILQMEHLSALAEESADDDTAGTGDAPGEPPDHFLVTEAHFQNRGSTIVLALDGVARPGAATSHTGREAVLAVSLARTDAHRLLDMFKRKADEAAWDLPAPSAWTEPPSGGRSGTVN